VETGYGSGPGQRLIKVTVNNTVLDAAIEPYVPVIDPADGQPLFVIIDKDGIRSKATPTTGRPVMKPLVKDYNVTSTSAGLINLTLNQVTGKAFIAGIELLPAVNTTLTAPANFTATASSATTLTLTWTDVAGETGYLLERGTEGGWSPVATLAANTTTHALTGLTASTGYTYRLRANNATGPSAAVLASATTPAPSAFDQWRTGFFTAAQLADTATSGPAADPDQDGVVNLVEYAFGMNPTSNTSAAVPGLVLSGGNATMSYTQPPGITGVTYRAEWSTTLAPNSWTTLPDTGTGTLHSFSIPLVGHSKMFMRWRISSP
jgi:hypothetical protein